MIPKLTKIQVPSSLKTMKKLIERNKLNSFNKYKMSSIRLKVFFSIYFCFFVLKQQLKLVKLKIINNQV
jgi:hypothetical protein